MGKLRLAFIGCGSQASLLQANLPHIAAIDFVSACDLDGAKAESNARRFGARKAYTDYRKMIEAERPDAVAICGPPQMHHELGLACLRLGCHIFLEKPPSIYAAQTKELADMAMQAGKMGMVATHWRHAPAHQMARQLADQPEFGPVLNFRCKYAAPGPKSGIWVTDSAIRGFLLGQIIHPVDCMRFLVGREVTEVYAAITELPDGTTSYAISFRFDGVFAHRPAGPAGLNAGHAGLPMGKNIGGPVGTMNLFGGTHTLMMETAIIGSSGRCVEVVEAERLTYYKEQPALGKGGYTDSPSIGWRQGNFYRGYGRPGYLEEFTHFATALLAGQQPRSSLADAYEDMRILEAIIESNATRKPVSLAH